LKKILIFVTLLSFAYGLNLGKLGDFSFQKLNDNVYVMHGPIMEPNVENKGFMNNPAIIESKNGLIVIDPGGNYNIGKEVVAEIEKVSKKPIIAVLNTHKHGDHWFANLAILKKYPKVKIYAHPQMIKEVKNGEADKWYEILDRLSHNLKGTKPYAFPNSELKDGQVLEIEGQKFEIIHPKKTHTDTDIIIKHTNSNTIFLGDNVMRGRLGGFDGSSSIFGNKELLEKLHKDTNAKLYVPGHGISGTKKEVIEPYLHYLSTLIKYAQKAYKADEEPYTVKEEMFKELKEYASWDAFKRQGAKHLQKAYLEVEAKDLGE